MIYQVLQILTATEHSLPFALSQSSLCIRYQNLFPHGKFRISCVLIPTAMVLAAAAVPQPECQDTDMLSRKHPCALHLCLFSFLFLS